MILQTNKKAEVLSSGIEDTIKMTIDETDKSVLMMILSEGLYSDPVGSLIREICSNALDSHREAGISEPIIVSLSRNDVGGYDFIVEDFGIGLSPERIENVFSKYVASTKRNTNDQIGAFGLGASSPLSYRDNFFIQSRWNGVEYQYMKSKGEEGTEISLLNSCSTIERNGVKITIPLKSSYDKLSFMNKIKEQLCYFENVYFNVEGINNDFKIEKHDLWKYSELCNDDMMHLCLDNVYYPLDFKKLGIADIQFPIGLNFSVKDGITPVPSRENILITPSTKELILDRIKEIANYFVRKYNESVEEKESILDIWDQLHWSYQEKVLVGNEYFQIKSLVKYSDIKIKNPSVKGIEKLDLKDLYHNFYKTDCFLKGFTGKYQLDGDRWKSKNVYDYTISTLKNGSRYIFITKDDVRGLIKDYIKDTYKHAVVVKETGWKRKLKVKDDGNCYFTLLKLFNFPKEEWRKRIQEYQSIEKEIHNRIISIESVIPTEQWLTDRKNNRQKNVATKVEKLEIYPKYGRTSEGASDCVFEKEKTVEIKDLGNNIVVYGKQEDKEKLSEFFVIFRALNRAEAPKVAILSGRDYDKIINVKNWYTVEEFMEGTTSLFGQICTAYICQTVQEENKFLFDNVNFISEIDSTLSDKMKELKKYTCRWNKFYEKELLEEMVEICKERDNFDKQWYTLQEELKEELKNIEFIGNLRTNKYGSQIDEFTLEFAKEIYQFKKQ